MRVVALVSLALVAIGVWLLDQGAKYLIVENLRAGESVPVLGEFFQFTFVRNSGGAFSLGSGTTWLFSSIAALVAVIIVVFARRIRAMSWAVLFGMLLGGTLGNLTDRLFREPSFGQGHVVDFLHISFFPAIFNIADIAIVSSMGLFILLTARGTGLDGSRPPRKAAKADAEGAAASDGA